MTSTKGGVAAVSLFLIQMESAYQHTEEQTTEFSTGLSTYLIVNHLLMYWLMKYS